MIQGFAPFFSVGIQTKQERLPDLGSQPKGRVVTDTINRASNCGAFPLAKAGGSRKLDINQGGGKDAEADTGNRGGNKERHSPEDREERHIHPEA